MDKTPKTPDSSGQRQRPRPPFAVVRRWLTQADMCARLDCSPRTLRRRVKQGSIERQRDGNHWLYRSEEHRTAAATSGGHTGQQRSGAVALAIEQRPTPATAPDTDTLALVGLVQQLTAELTEAHGQRGEAIGIGHMLADERDTLRARVEVLEARLAQLLASPRSLLVRRQLLDMLTRQTGPLVWR